MNWLGQNWVWVVLLAVGVLFLMRRRGHHHGFGRSMGHHHRHGDGYVGSDSHQAMDQGASRDPVSGGEVSGSGAVISVVFRGRAYYFENAENRAAFEANPEQYVHGGDGQTVADDRHDHHHHRRRGC